MNYLDLTAIFVFFGSGLLGFLRGGAKEIVGFGGWIRAFIIAFFFAGFVAPLLTNLVLNNQLRWFAAFSVVFMFERMVSYALGILLTELVKAAHLEMLNKIIGLFLGAVRGITLILLMTVLCMTTLVPTTKPWKSSRFAPMAEHMARTLTPFFVKDLPPFMKKEDAF
jgi:membrane protein required for colicin V production